MTDPSVDALRRYCTALETGIAGCMAEIAPGIILHTVPCEASPNAIHTGRDAVEAALQARFGDLRLRWSRLDVHATDDPTVAVALAMSDTARADGGAECEPHMFWANIEDGKIVELFQFTGAAPGAGLDNTPE
jgi:hypothetical protein